MLSLSDTITENSIVFSGSQYFIVIARERENLVLCPFVTDSEPHHRRDLALAWFDLAGTGLPRADLRVRAIPWRRRVRSVQFVGIAETTMTARVKKALRAEMVARSCEGVTSRLLHSPREARRGKSGGSIRAVVF